MDKYILMTYSSKFVRLSSIPQQQKHRINAVACCGIMERSDSVLIIKLLLLIE